MAATERARLIAVLQSARPMRIFRNCRYFSSEAIDEILTLSARNPSDDVIAAVGDAARRAKHAPLTDGSRIRAAEIDELLARLGA
jgi:hypothetical protein